jgi:hypothetical protein
MAIAIKPPSAVRIDPLIMLLLLLALDRPTWSHRRADLSPSRGGDTV